MGVKTEGEGEGLHESVRTVRVREKRGGGSQREDRGEVDGNIDLLRVPCPRLHPAHPPEAPSPSRGSARISAPCVPSRALATHLSCAVPCPRSTPHVISPSGCALQYDRHAQSENVAVDRDLLSSQARYPHNFPGQQALHPRVGTLIATAPARPSMICRFLPCVRSVRICIYVRECGT